MDKLEARSALYTEYRAGEYGAKPDQSITLCERRGLSMFNLVVWDANTVSRLLHQHLTLTLPGPGQSTADEKTSVLWAGPDRYLIVTNDASLKDTLSDMSDEQGALQDLSCARTVIRIQGLSCRAVMAKGLTVDLSLDEFLSGQVVLSSFDHHFPAIVHNISADQDTFDIYIARSFALSFWHWLCDSSLEFGYQVLDPEHNG